MTTVVGIDTSLTNTGLVVVSENGHMITNVKSKPPKTPRGPKNKPLPPTLAQRTERLRGLMVQICQLTFKYDPELVVIEQPSYGNNQGSAHDRSGLWWLVVEELANEGLPIAEVSPSTRPIYATGNGTSGKDEVLAAVIKRYPDYSVTDNNVADALTLAMMGMRAIGHPLDELPQTHLRAMDKVKWPDGPLNVPTFS